MPKGEKNIAKRKLLCRKERRNDVKKGGESNKKNK